MDSRKHYVGYILSWSGGDSEVTFVECAREEDAAAYFAADAYDVYLDYRPFECGQSVGSMVFCLAERSGIHVGSGEIAEGFPAERYFSIQCHH